MRASFFDCYYIQQSSKADALEQRIKWAFDNLCNSKNLICKSLTDNSIFKHILYSNSLLKFFTHILYSYSLLKKSLMAAKCLS